MGVISKTFQISLLALLALGISGCGGGGGGGDGSGSTAQALAYSGNTDPAIITTDNARMLAANVIGSSNAGLSFSSGVAAQQQSSKTVDLIQLAPRLSKELRGILNHATGSSDAETGQSIAGLDINETAPCLQEGTVSISGNLNDATGTGTLNFAFNNCNDVGTWFNGQATFTIDAYDFAYDFFTDTTISFTLIQVRDADTDISISGSLRSQVTIATSQERTSGSFIARDNTSGEFARVDNLDIIVAYNSIFNPSSYSLGIVSCRVFDTIEGYVDAATTAPWFYATLTQEFPSSGGVLVLTGANNARVSVTPVSGTFTKVELDLDANGVHELASTMPWMVLVGTPPATNTAPVAHAGADQTVPKGIQVALDGSGSSDPDYDYLTYQWTLTQKPGGSLAQLSNAGGVNPILTPDRDGSYSVSLVVNDGKTNSVASIISITAFNIVPVADAGQLQLVFAGTQINLDGSKSFDSNNDPLTYSWNISLKPPGSTAALSSTDTANPFFTSDVSGIYRLSLTVNDGTIDSQVSAVVVFAVEAPPSTAQPLRVPGDFSTIQAAINSAAPGDTIVVEPGTYVENLRFDGKAVTLQSTSGPTRTIIEGINDTAVDIGPNGAIIGFIIQKGVASFGAGMAVHGTGTLIKHNIFQSNTQSGGGFGAAIGGNNASPTIERNIFRDNTCDNQFLSGVISFVNSSSPVIVNNILHDNPCRAINMSLPGGTLPLVTNNTIVLNRAGIYVDRRIDTSQQVYRNNILVGNDIGLEIVFGTDTYDPTWQNNLVFGNGANYSGTTDKTGAAGNISADPMLVDQTGGFYYLSAGSPAIDQGTDTDAPTVDFTGKSRPHDGNGDSSAVTDIGAFEYQTP